MRQNDALYKARFQKPHLRHNALTAQRLTAAHIAARLLDDLAA